MAWASGVTFRLDQGLRRLEPSLGGTSSKLEFEHTSNTSATQQCNCGVYGSGSPRRSASGLVAIPVSGSLQACAPNTQFSTSHQPWIALIQSGSCSFADKIQVAARRGAAAVVIYNAQGKGNDVFPMKPLGAENIVAIMIGNRKGMEILHRIKSGLRVTMAINAGKTFGLLVILYTIFFISVLFLTTLIAIMCYYIWYSVRRCNVAGALSDSQQQLRAMTKLAIEHFELRTMKQGDKELGPEGEICVVYLEPFQPKQDMRVLTCKHLFHQCCTDPCLLEHRICSVCKWDIFNVLRVEVDVEAAEQGRGSSGRAYVSTVDEVGDNSEAASSGQDTLQTTNESLLQEEPPVEFHNVQLVIKDTQPLDANVLPQDNHTSSEADEAEVGELDPVEDPTAGHRPSAILTDWL
ncbi:E3 ubiquitin-protein ligase RNF128-like [Colius striatus]|uniref:E3 ubiquitin-protein ligase RNF128-like n=1 Tax=Colius striatus TaxID=57412 RepID=UPI002B1E58F5|nr:E3 ubiquitin-protein ligase RNF128-like [Colius striatus]